MRPVPSASVPCLLLALVLVGCGGNPLSPPTAPAIDWTAPFPELSPASEAAAYQPGEPPEATPGRESGHRSVPLAGRFAADLVDDGPVGGWRLFQDETLTVLIHTSGSDDPDALVYAETFSAVAQNHPGEEMRRFLLTVDPGLTRSDPAWGSAPIAIAATLGNESPGVQRGLGKAAGLAMTRTGGRGLGYTSEPDSFSGWRWIGPNPRGVFLRLARSHGSWGDQGLLEPALHAPVDRLIQKFPQLAWMKAGRAIPGTAQPVGRSPVPAYMVFGSASFPEGGVHLALLCTRTPSCGSAPALAGLLSSLRPISAGDLDAAGDALPPEELEIETGLVLAPHSGVLSPSSPATAP
ncbi:MAG TPA: hypothetical protein VJ885_06025 [Thermoanaerobaculia bacterium]|nr:hypothetical protein [Thermoanaerobaculia bacterium]